MRQMTLVAFLQAQNCTNLPCSWRHPQSRTDAWSADYYRHIGRVLEEGKFHLGFFDDRLSMPDIYGHDHAHTVRHGIRCVKMDAVTVLTVMGMAAERLGLGATYSTSYYEPFHVARLFATLDLMTDGRAAWNVVTSLNDGEAQNMGREEVIEHDLRYDRADEFMEVVFGHWDSWEDDAIVQDKARGLFAHPDKVHRLDHKGRFFRSRGPFTVPRSPQGRPVIIQAGQSGRGKRFGAQWGELIFVVYPNITVGKRDYAGFKAEVPAAAATPRRSRSRIWSAPWPLRVGWRPKTNGPSSISCRSRSTRSRFSRKRSTSTSRPKGWTRHSPTKRWRQFPACRPSATASCGLVVIKIRRSGSSCTIADAAACTIPSSAARKRSAMRSNNGSLSARATASSFPRPMFPEPTRTSFASWCPSFSAAASFARPMREKPCART